MNFLNSQPGNVSGQPFPVPTASQPFVIPPNPFMAQPNQSATAAYNPQQQWCQNIPTIMPWSDGVVPNNCQTPIVNGAFAFTSIPTPVNSPITVNIPGQSQPFPNVPFGCDTSAAAPATAKSPISPNPCRQKRPFNPNETSMSTTEFDFENNRPVKKYVCDDKVLEIFDRLHIREQNIEQYIVEDCIETKSSPSNPGSKVQIEELSTDNAVLELSPELKEVIKNSSSTGITEKLLQAEREKLDKAVILWQPAKSLLDKISNNNDDSDDDDDDDEKKRKSKHRSSSTIEIEEIFSDDDDDEMMMSTQNGGEMLIEPYPDDDLIME